jgi:nucleoside-diphosphate-sugar epimerase
MTVFVIGGTGFIGSRLTRSLVKRGERVVCFDINTDTADFSDLGDPGDKVTVVHGDLTQFDDVMSRMTEAEPDRVINLSYFLGSHHAPHVATKLNVVGMDNCFEAARQAGHLCELARGLRTAKPLRRPRGHRRRPPLRPQTIRHPQNLQRVAGRRFHG